MASTFASVHALLVALFVESTERSTMCDFEGGSRLVGAEDDAPTAGASPMTERCRFAQRWQMKTPKLTLA